MKIILDLRGWRKTVELDNETTIRVVKCGYVEIALLKPLDILAKEADIKMNVISDSMTLIFSHYGYFLDNLPIYKYEIGDKE